MRIAKEVDAMMWEIANTGDFQAIENFKKQFPDMHAELSRRVLLIKDLRKAKSLPLAPVTRPRFVPSAKVRHYISWPGISALAVGIAVAAAAGSLEAVDRYQASATGLSPSLGPRLIDSPQIQQAMRSRGGYMPSASPLQAPPEVKYDTKLPQAAGTPVASQPPPMQGTLPKSTPTSAPIRVSFNQVPLSKVVEVVAYMFKLDIKRAPGLPDPVVSINDQDTDGKALLDRLGNQNGFGVVSEGANSVLLVPLDQSP